MDKGKEINKRVISDTKKVGISKSVLKNNHIGIKSNTPRKFSYISRSKNVSIPFDNKTYIYSDSKSFLKQSCDKFKIGSHLSVKPEHQVASVEASHDLNCNLSFNQHSSFCNFPSVSEVPNFGVRYQTQHRYDLSVPRSSKHRKYGFHEKRAFNSKTTSSKGPFCLNKFFAQGLQGPVAKITYTKSDGTIGTLYSDSTLEALSNSIPFVKFPTNRVSSDASIVTEKYPKCYVTTHVIRDPYSQGNVRIVNDDHFFAPSIIPDKTEFTFQVGEETQLCNLKSDYFIHNWPQMPVSTISENPVDIKDAVPPLKTNEQMKSPPDLECVPNVMPPTSPLETSVIPQASYADVIRMSPCSVDNSKISDFELFSEKVQPDTHYNQNIQATVVNLEKPSFYNSVNKNMSPPSLSERYIKRDDKMLSSSSAYSSSFPSDSTSRVDGQTSSDSMYSSSSTNAFKTIGKKPVIIMDNSPDNVSQITFGIEYDEMVKLCFDNSVQECSENHVENQAICDEKTRLVMNEKELYWKEPNTKYCEDNHIELTNYFASLWKECERNPDLESSQNSTIKIYQDV